MKRLTSLVLALLLALTMMVGAFAETADVTGEWYGELLGIQVTLTINADGTYKMDIAGMDSEEGVWEKNEDGNLVMDKGTDGEGLVTVTETGLSTEQDGMKIDFTREAPAEDEELTIKHGDDGRRTARQVAGDERHHERHERADEHGGSGVHH